MNTTFNQQQNMGALNWLLSLGLGALFIFVGLNKLTDQIDPELHSKMVSCASSLQIIIFLCTHLLLLD